MHDFSPSDLKTILHSKRTNMYYLVHCRVMQNDEWVLLLDQGAKSEFLWVMEGVKLKNDALLTSGYEVCNNA